MSKEGELSGTLLESPVGPLTLLASTKGLVGVYFENRFDGDWNETSNEFLEQIAQQLTEYFQGKRQEFAIPFDLRGTAFQKEVWQTLATIPYGETISYRELAERIQRPKASRAVGLANGNNPISIILPCHRVIGSNGKLVGYGGGLERKLKLLELEDALLPIAG